MRQSKETNDVFQRMSATEQTVKKWGDELVVGDRIWLSVQFPNWEKFLVTERERVTVRTRESFFTLNKSFDVEGEVLRLNRLKLVKESRKHKG